MVRQASLNSSFLEQHTQIKEINLMSHHADCYGHTIKCNVAYDGNCFFSAICALTGRNSADDAGKLRMELSSFLQSKVCTNDSIPY